MQWKKFLEAVAFASAAAAVPVLVAAFDDAALSLLEARQAGSVALQSALAAALATWAYLRQPPQTVAQAEKALVKAEDAAQK
jgi:hypothetical protein